MNVRVLVTRPPQQSAVTAEALAALGYEPVVLPLTQTTPLPIGPASLPSGIAAVAVTSANAIRHAPAALIERLTGLTCYAVGKKSAQAARAAGFVAVETGGGEAADLAALVIARRATPLLYFCGRVRRDGFEATLLRAGIMVTAVETYDTVALRPKAGDVLSTLGGMPLDVALLYSEQAAQAIARLALLPELGPAFARTRYLCLSGRIAESLAGRLPAAKIAVAAEPTEAALLSLIGVS